MINYPKTPHFPWSHITDSTDDILSTVNCFINRRVIITEKMDGENLMIRKNDLVLKDRKIFFEADDWLINYSKNIQIALEEKQTIVAEYLYYKLSIKYKELDSFCLGISVWDNETCLSWDETKGILRNLKIKTVPVIYDGIWDWNIISKLTDDVNKNDQSEGYTIRVSDEFSLSNFKFSIAKYVRPMFKQVKTVNMQNRVENCINN